MQNYEGMTQKLRTRSTYEAIRGIWGGFPPYPSPLELVTLPDSKMN